jgi:glycosyltransferase involved in cell wall biosynthesis
LDILIDALAILKEKEVRFKCFIIGNGIERSNIEKQIALYQLSDLVELLGERYQKECYAFFNQSDIFVLPGKVGLSIIHGLSYGLPVITSDKLEIHSPEYEIIKKGYNGDFFEKLDPKNLADKIILWAGKIKSGGNNEIKKQCISSIIEGDYTPQSMSNKMIQFFKTLSN